MATATMMILILKMMRNAVEIKIMRRDAPDAHEGLQLMRAICSGRWGATLRFAWESQLQGASKKYLLHEIWYPRIVLKAALGCMYTSASFTRILSKEYLARTRRPFRRS